MEDQLVKVLAGDRAAQKQFYLQHADYLMSVVWRYADHLADAQEVLQIVFIKIFRNIKNYDQSKSAIRTWMHNIAIRESVRYVQRCKSLKYADITQIDSVENNPALNQLELAQVQDTIEQLPEKNKLILKLFFFEGWTHKEIAPVLGIKESSSRSLLTRSKKLLLAQYQVLNKISYGE